PQLRNRSGVGHDAGDRRRWSKGRGAERGRRAMKIVIFGLTISSTWGNGHATLWRGLCRALARRGHTVTFFERDVPYYAANRDLWDPPGCRLRLYESWDENAAEARRETSEATVAMVTSYCPDARAAA